MEYLYKCCGEKYSKDRLGRVFSGKGENLMQFLTGWTERALPGFKQNLKKVKEGVWYDGEVEWAQMR